jgi:hypothetical protein
MTISIQTTVSFVVCRIRSGLAVVPPGNQSFSRDVNHLSKVDKI